MKPTTQEIIEILQLKPHPTCGFTNETYLSNARISGEALPAGYGEGAGSRALGGVLYFLVTPAAQIKLHRIRADQMYHHYLGDPLEVLLLRPDGKSEVQIVGGNLAAGERPQLLIPGGTFHTSRLRAGNEYALLGTSIWLRPEPADVEAGDPDRLAAEFPAAAELIRAFAQHN